MRIFDTHAHYDDRAFDEDRDEVLASFPANNIEKVVTIGTRLDTSRASISLAESYDFMFAAVGIHPEDIEDEKANLDEILRNLREMSKHEKVVAIGEIGLDYHYTKETKAKQFEYFEAQIELAKEVKLPIIVHSREAAQDTFDIMKASKACDAGGVLHCFSYSKEMAKAFLDMGFYIGFGGSSTFKNAVNLREVISYVPMDKIVIETDCPYLSPVPFRGKRNTSLNLPYVIENIAAIKNMTASEVAELTFKNGEKLYQMI